MCILSWVLIVVQGIIIIIFMATDHFVILLFFWFTVKYSCRWILLILMFWRVWFIFYHSHKFSTIEYNVRPIISSQKPNSLTIFFNWWYKGSTNILRLKILMGNRRKFFISLFVKVIGYMHLFIWKVKWCCSPVKGVMKRNGYRVLYFLFLKVTKDPPRVLLLLV